MTTSEIPRAVVVFESMFGNTRLIAETVALGVGVTMPVSVIDAASAPTTFGPQIALVVVGAPTHALGLPRGSTREDAVRKLPELARPRTDGVREWLDALRRAPADAHRPIVVGTYDTRVHTPVHLGSAGRGIARRMHRLGFNVASTTSFYVGGTTGPVNEGELDRARSWGTELAVRADQLVHAAG